MGKSAKVICTSLFFVMCFSDKIDQDFYMQPTSHTLKVISELPSLAHVFQYISALRRLVQFLAVHKNCMDFGMKFGLFLLNVNLRSFMQDDNLIPSSLRTEIKYLIEESDKLHKYFDLTLIQQKLKQPLREDFNTTAMYISMLTDDVAWSRQILRLDLDLLKEIYSYTYEFPEWSRYTAEVEDLNKWLPDTELSNTCLAMLAHNEVTNGNFPNCNLGQDCLEMLDFGTNFGYALSYKLLFLLLARLSRECTVFSSLQDERVRHHLCKSAYRESEYIADNNFLMVDLMAEHISFCTLEGHAQFLRSSWFVEFLRHQTPFGYFTNDIRPASLAAVRKRYEQRNATAVIDDSCLEHINAAMVGAFSAAIRFILENYH